MERWEAKLVAMIVIFVVMEICGLVPIWLEKWTAKQGSRGQFVIAILTCFGGGVFFSAYLLHLLPEARHMLEDAYMDPNDVHYPLPELTAGGSFLLVLTLEKFVIWNHIRRAKRKATVSINEQEMQGENAADSNGQANASFEPDAHDTVTSGEKVTNDKEVEQGAPTKSATDVEVTQSIILIMSMSTCGFFEGMALGLQTTSDGVFLMFWVIISHETLMAFCTGIELVKHYKTSKVVLGVTLYCLIVPVGIGTGMIVYETQEEASDALNITTGVLLAVSAGCFIYVTFFGILVDQLAGADPWSKLLAVAVGFTFIACLMLIPHPHGDDHDHDHDHDHDVTTSVMTTLFNGMLQTTAASP